MAESCSLVPGVSSKGLMLLSKSQSCFEDFLGIMSLDSSPTFNYGYDVTSDPHLMRKLHFATGMVKERDSVIYVL